MKKAMFLTIILALLIFAGCGSGNKEEKTADTGDTIADTGISEGENGATFEDADTDSSGVDPADSEESIVDMLDESDSETEEEDLSCHTVDDTTWSPLSSGTMNWEEAASYCENLSVCEYDDWRLPNIDELRQLVKNCPKIKPAGECMISEDDLLSYMDAKEAGAWEGVCEGEWEAGCDDGACVCSRSDYPEIPGYFSEIEDSNIELWSSSAVSDETDKVWNLRFNLSNSVDIIAEDTQRTSFVRCVR